eukprot:scaffold1744_cov340-Prasinococcus_capsulatus_cf.AAC.24
MRVCLLRSFLSDRKTRHSSGSDSSFSPSLAHMLPSARTEEDQGQSSDDARYDAGVATPADHLSQAAQVGEAWSVQLHKIEGISDSPLVTLSRPPTMMTPMAPGEATLRYDEPASLAPNASYAQQLKEEIAGLEMELPALRAEVQAAQDQLEELKKLKEEMQLSDANEVSSLKAQIDELNEQHTSYCEELQREIEAKVEAWQQRLVEAEGVAVERASQDTLPKHEAELLVANARDEERKLHHDAMLTVERQCSSLKEQLSALREESAGQLKQVQLDSDNARAKMESDHSKEIADLERALREASSEAARHQEALRSTAALYEQNEKTLQDKVEERELELREAKSRLSAHAGELTRQLDAAQKQAGEEVSAQGDCIRELEERVVEQLQELSDATARAEAAETAQARLTEAKQENDAAVAALREEIGELNTAKSERDARVEALEEEVLALKELQEYSSSEQHALVHLAGARPCASAGSCVISSTTSIYKCLCTGRHTYTTTRRVR